MDSQQRYHKGDYQSLINELQNAPSEADKLLLAKCYLYTDQHQHCRSTLNLIENAEASTLIEILDYIENSIPVKNPQLKAVIDWVEADRRQVSTQENSIIMSLGSPTDANNRPLIRLQRTLEKTLSIWQERKLPIIVTGGAVSSETEAHCMNTWLLESGVDTPIYLEDSSINTIENFKHSREILDQLTIDHVYLVSAPYHVKRSCLIANALIPHIEFVPCPAENDGTDLCKRQIIETYATYRDITRIKGLWT
jgi:uncharacterized SAM-binding protein YcdF (DUF218 family)